MWVKDRVTSLRTKFKLIFKQPYLNTGHHMNKKVSTYERASILETTK